MSSSKENIVFAALDIGSSNVKLALYHPAGSSRIIHAGSIENAFIYRPGGVVLSDFTKTLDACFSLFANLASQIKELKPLKLYLGICSHVSSLLEWDKDNGRVKENLFPVWMDSSCKDALGEFRDLMTSEIIQGSTGTFIPPGTNWLLTKLLGKKDRQVHGKSVYVQAGDAVFAVLTGSLFTHFSSQVSMVHQYDKHYAAGVVDYLGLETGCFPAIAGHTFFPVLESFKTRFSFPAETFILPSMADFYAAFEGLRLEPNEAFILGNTSEIAGHFSSSMHATHPSFMHTAVGNGFIRYGSTSSGGNTINWFLKNILNRPVNDQVLSKLTGKAMRTDPALCPLFLPYLDGERAPFWNSSMTGTFSGLRGFHTREHLFRAILESVAFARRQLLEKLEGVQSKGIKFGGGSSSNTLWNTIRASVLNKPLLVSSEKELSLLGVLDTMITQSGLAGKIDRPVVDFLPVMPDNELVKLYETRYRDFLSLQNKLYNDIDE